MSESKEHFYRDFSKFDEMSTEELNEILRQDSQLPDGEDSDTDAILYIMGVIAKRNQELPSSDFGDVNHAWSSFNKNYRFASSEGRSLFDFDDEPQLNGTSDKTQILQPAPRSNTRPRKWVLRTARILAAVIAVLLATSLTAYAFGFDLWGAIANWTKETFGFKSSEYTQTVARSSAKEIPAPLTSIANEMEIHGIPTAILPSYLPDGFVETDFQYNAVTQPVSFYCLLGNGDSSITLLYTVFSENQDHLLYEKDTVDPEQYEYNGTVIADTLDQLDRLQSGEVSRGVPTGFRDIDDVTQGLQPGQMIVVAGRPAMGKSTLGVDFARSAALHHGLTTIIFSLEMSKNELAQRIISAESNIPLAAMRRADDITPERWAILNELQGKLQNAPLFIDDSPNMSLMEIRAKCRRLKQTNDLKLVVIDYLQLMTSGKAVESRQQEVSDFSRALKLLAKELEVPVVALSQLNRGPEMRQDKKPQLSDLRESGSIEQDADVVFLVHRPDAYDKEDRPGEADIIMAKHRNGPTDTFNLAFLGAYSKFKDMPQDYQSQQEAV